MKQQLWDAGVAYTDTLVHQQVIGIMDCQEWPDGNMGPGHQQFQQVLAKVRTAAWSVLVQVVDSLPSNIHFLSTTVSVGSSQPVLCL